MCSDASLLSLIQMVRVVPGDVLALAAVCWPAWNNCTQVDLTAPSATANLPVLRCVKNAWSLFVPEEEGIYIYQVY